LGAELRYSFFMVKMPVSRRLVNDAESTRQNQMEMIVSGPRQLDDDDEMC